MELKIGAILDGTVKNLAKFGAFVRLPDGSTGMVHISEVANGFVRDIRDHLSEGQAVRVMVIGTEPGKISLSIKRALPQEPAPPAPPQEKSFDDMLRRFMTESDSRVSSSKLYADHKTKTRKR